MSSPPTRREAIGNGLAFVALGSAMPTFLMQAACPATAATSRPLPGASVPPGKILVLIELSGGNDGLNTLIPHKDPHYAKLRPNIGLPAADLVPVNANLGLHPALKPLEPLYKQGHLAVVTGVGYPNPNRSHFQAMDIWQSGEPAVGARQRTGWLARYFDKEGHLRGQPLASLSMSGSLPLALYADRLAASVYDERETLFDGDDPDRKRQRDALRALYAEGTVAGSHAEFIRKVGTDAYACTQEIKQALKAYDTKAGKAAKYPDNGLANSLQTVAKLIGGGLSTRAYYVTLGGFDTHANQPDTHARLMDNLGTALMAFLQDLSRQGRGRDVIVMTYSEFGRRVKENASAGTDHGAASVLFVAGSAVKGGVHGAHPSLEDLDDGDLRFHTDFRSVYATLLDRWLGSPSEAVLNGKFKPLDFV